MLSCKKKQTAYLLAGSVPRNRKMSGIYNCGTEAGGISQDMEMGNTGFGIYYAQIMSEEDCLLDGNILGKLCLKM